MTPGQVYTQNVDAVVSVVCRVQSGNGYGESSGSGFLISADGYVVTNYHVIEGATEVVVVPHGAKEMTATVVGSDVTNDVALLKVEGQNLPCVTIGSSDALAVGDQVVAIGNPLGELTATLTVGYVSAKDRIVDTDGTVINMLQTDAAINSGNSGGPLFNARGEVVGINTAKYSGTSSSGATIEGIGFAIPIDDVAGIIGDLQDKGYVSSTYLGVYVSEVDATAQQNYGIPAGASVLEVTPGYCAEKAGIQAKDIIIAVGEYKVDSLSALSRALRRFEPGDTTTLTVRRAGVELKLEITLDEKPQQIPESSHPQDQEQEQQPSQEPPAQEEEDGFSFEDFLDRFFGFG
jgi:serine protease Do